jgi:hypothetical protein
VRLETSRRHDFSNQVESLFAPVLTIYTENNEICAQMEDNTKTKQMFAVAMKKESDEESSSCPDGSIVGDHDYHLREEVVSIMENITPTNPETETADSSQADNPAAEALLAAQTEFAQKTSSLLISYQDRLNEIRDDNAIEDTPYSEVLTDVQKSEIINTRKQEASEQAYRETLLGYEQAIAEAAEKAQEHAESLREALFGIGEGGSAALGQAVTASESQLLQMLDGANLAGDTNVAPILGHRDGREDLRQG